MPTYISLLMYAVHINVWLYTPTTQPNEKIMYIACVKREKEIWSKRDTLGRAKENACVWERERGLEGVSCRFLVVCACIACVFTKVGLDVVVWG